MTTRTAKTIQWFKTPIPRIQVLPMYVVVVILLFGAIQESRQEAQQRDYTQCLARVDTRESLREILLAITDLFPEGDGATAIRNLIESEYPVLQANEECGDIRP